ncbi:PQQ-dependent sugar dehydrogenase [Terrimonas alba]|uniref:PQQ-dependent sugar dehydrogenase n=1 Tax=Terrimonas alba TaxID=3349636 RepID=UPI0035F2EC39
MKEKHLSTLVKNLHVITTAVFLITGLLLMHSCHKNDHHSPFDKVDLELVADGFVSPLGVVAVPDDSDRLFIIDQAGKIWIIDASGNKLSTPFIDVTSMMVPLMPNFDERGLLGLAFHPDYKTNGRFFIYYQLPPRAGGPEEGESWNNLSRISEFKVSASDPNLADMGSEKVILEWDDPQFNHNGGTIAFGPDGYLYIAVGDGGAADDVAPGHVEDWYAANEGGNGQDIEANLLGNILRIDINVSPYGIPADNPFVGKPGLDEIYAYGFRNPYRISFDMSGSRQLYAGDAGQVLYEEIDLVTKGGNYGWNVKEGTHCFNAANNDTLLPSCPDVDNFGNPLIDPVIEVINAANPMGGGKALTIIGGNVYRGNSIPGFQGKYIFGTFGQTFTAPDGELFIATPAGPGPWKYDEIDLKSFPNDLGHYLKGFGQDNDGEVYLTVSTALGPSGTTGKVFKLVRVKK